VLYVLKGALDTFLEAYQNSLMFFRICTGLLPWAERIVESYLSSFCTLTSHDLLKVRNFLSEQEVEHRLSPREGDTPSGPPEEEKTIRAVHTQNKVKFKQ
jgi:hypothetical protein